MQFTKYDKPVGFKKSWWADTAPEKNKKGENLIGECSFCNRWAPELRQGLCLEEDCIKGRKLYALATGTAGFAITGLPGNKEVYTIKDERQIINTPIQKTVAKPKEKLTKQQRRKANKLAKAQAEAKQKYVDYKAKKEIFNRQQYALKLKMPFKTIDNKKVITKEICDLLGYEENEESVITVEDDKIINYWPIGNDKYLSMNCEDAEIYKNMPAIISYDNEVYSKIEFAIGDKQALYKIDHKLQSRLSKQERLKEAWKADKQKRFGE